MHKILICISVWKDTLLLMLFPGVWQSTAEHRGGHHHMLKVIHLALGGLEERNPFLTMDGNFLVDSSPFWETFWEQERLEHANTFFFFFFFTF